MAPFARAVAAAGHEVRFATADEFRPMIEREGFPTFAAGVSLPGQLERAAAEYPETHGMPPGKERFEAHVPRMLGGVAAPARVADLMRAIEEWPPDVLVHDETEFGGPVAAAASGVPYADHSVGFLRPLTMARLTGEVLAPVWEQWGVDLGPFGGLFRYLYLDVCPPSLQSPEIEKIWVAHPMQNVEIGAPADEVPPPWLDELPDRPTVYVSLGTIFARVGAFAAVLAGLGSEALNVIVTVGAGNDPAALGPQPDNVHVERYISQSLLLPYCDVVVNQGGTAILPILAHGLPLLVLPQGANQFHNAEACVAAGVGRSLQPAGITADSVKREVRLLLDDPSYKASADAVGAEIAAMPGPADAVPLLERLASDREPIVGR
jgi:UDP:flavonoid glycosyltransferase YjiC (YdhE family)